MKRMKMLGLSGLLALSALAGMANAAGLIENFNSPVMVSPTPAPGAWYTDRYAPFGFTNAIFGGDSRLKHSIDASACEGCRGPSFNGAFYNTQGRALDFPAGTTSMSVQMYVPSSWATTGARMAGFWGVGRNPSNAVSSYPIIEFCSNSEGTGLPRFRGYHTTLGTWTDMGLPTGFAYDTWQTVSIKLVGSNWVYQVGDLTLTMPAGTSTRLGSTILQGHNSVPGSTYDIYWDNLYASDTGVSLNSAACATTSNVSVTIDMAATSENVVGGQFFLNFDTSRLDFVSATPGGGGSPFTIEIFESVNEGAGTIDYAVGAPFGDPGTLGPSTLVTLNFAWVGPDECTTPANLVSFRTGTPVPTRLTNAQSQPLMPALTNMGSISVDRTAPSISCPPNINVNADAGGCSAAATSLLGEGAGFFGDGSLVQEGGNLVGRLPSITGMPFQYAGYYQYPAAPYTMASVSSIGMDYKMTQGCLSGGSPRFVFSVDTDNNGVSNGTIICHVANPPSFNDCPPLNQWLSTGNLISATDARWEIGGSLGGGPYRTHAQMLADFSSAQVLVAYVVTDSAWNGNDDMLVDNVDINGVVQGFNNATASDNCGVPGVTGVRSDSQPLTAPYPSGVTNITWTATDACGNTSSCVQTVTVNNQNTMTATVELESVEPGPFTRCITFGLDNAGCTSFVDVPMTFTNGIATATFNVPCGDWNCVTARDRKHTLRRTVLTGTSGTEYVVNFTGVGEKLLGGNINDDNVIDILDFGGFTGQFAQNVGANTACGYSGLHADFSGSGIVDVPDFTYIQIHFLNFSEADCCGNVRDGGITAISVDELHATGRSEYAAGDVNADGMLDTQDIDVFMAHGGFPVCTQDFDGDSDYGTDADIEAFFACLGGNCCQLCGSSDFNGDGDFGTDADIESFFRVLGGGAC